MVRLVAPVSGITLPAEGFVVEKDFRLVASKEKSPLPRVFAIFQIPDDSERTRNNCLNRLNRFLDCYSFHTGFPADFSQYYAVSPMREVSGEATWSPGFEEVRVNIGVAPDRAEGVLSASVDMCGRRYQEYLQNALTFYRRSLLARTNDEALIDLITALESMFSLESQEIRYRLSLRVACFVAGMDAKLRKQVYDTVHEMYGKRNRIIHSGKSTDGVTLGEIGTLRDFVRISISKLMEITQTKKDVVAGIDSVIIKWRMTDTKNRHSN